MNCQLKDITVTARDGRVSHLDQVYIRGSHVRYFIVPDMLRLENPKPRFWRSRLIDLAGMRPCLGLGVCVVEVLVWPEEGRQSTGRGDTGVADRKVMRSSMALQPRLRIMAANNTILRPTTVHETGIMAARAARRAIYGEMLQILTNTDAAGTISLSVQVKKLESDGVQNEGCDPNRVRSPRPSDSEENEIYSKSASSGLSGSCIRATSCHRSLRTPV